MVLDSVEVIAEIFDMSPYNEIMNETVDVRAAREAFDDHDDLRGYSQINQYLCSILRIHR